MLSLREAYIFIHFIYSDSPNPYNGNNSQWFFDLLLTYYVATH